MAGGSRAGVGVDAVVDVDDAVGSFCSLFLRRGARVDADADGADGVAGGSSSTTRVPVVALVVEDAGAGGSFCQGRCRCRCRY